MFRSVVRATVATVATVETQISNAVAVAVEGVATVKARKARAVLAKAPRKAPVAKARKAPVAKAPRKARHNAAPLDFSGLKLTQWARDVIAQDPEFFAVWPRNILRLDGNAKTVKGNDIGFATAILYMIPADGATEQNLCALAVLARCKAPCLVSSGRGAFASVAKARLRKTLAFLSDPARFMRQIHEELIGMRREAARMGATLLVRLNGTSDIRFENYAFDGFDNIFIANPDVQFYDYTKLSNRKNITSNYDLTFSYSGAPEFAPHVARAVAAGMRLAVVFRTRKIVERMLTNGEQFQGLALVDGDDNDVRHIDPAGCVVALYAKGKARQDQSGFVVG